MDLSFINFLERIGIIDMSTADKIKTIVEYYKGKEVAAAPLVLPSANESELLVEVARLTTALALVEGTLKEIDELADGYIKEIPTAVEAVVAKSEVTPVVGGVVDTVPASFVIQYPSA